MLSLGKFPQDKIFSIAFHHPVKTHQQIDFSGL
jgi:hypothetical protein